MSGKKLHHCITTKHWVASTPSTMPIAADPCIMARGARGSCHAVMCTWHFAAMTVYHLPLHLTGILIQTSFVFHLYYIKIPSYLAQYILLKKQLILMLINFSWFLFILRLLFLTPFSYTSNFTISYIMSFIEPILFNFAILSVSSFSKWKHYNC